jgi:cytochrome c5
MTTRAAHTYSNFRPSPLQNKVTMVVVVVVLEMKATAAHLLAKYWALPLKNIQLPLAAWLTIDDAADADAADEAAAETTLALRDDFSGESCATPDDAVAAAAAAAADIDDDDDDVYATACSACEPLPSIVLPPAAASARADAGRAEASARTLLPEADA